MNLDLKKRKKLKLKLSAKNKVQASSATSTSTGLAVKSLKLGKKKKKLKRLNGIVSEKAVDAVATATVSKFEVKSTRASAPVKKVAEPLPEIIKTQVDLFKWPFRRDHKGVIKRENWNLLVQRIQKAGAVEAEAELDQTNQQLQQVLNDRDNILKKYQDLSAFMSKFTRNFQATYEVSK